MVTPDVIGYRRLPRGMWSTPFGTRIQTNEAGFRDAEPPASAVPGELMAVAGHSAVDQLAVLLADGLRSEPHLL